MKRYYILIFALLGLCFLDWSCGGNCDRYKPTESNVTGISKIGISVLDSSHRTSTYKQNDTTSYDKLQFSIDRILMLVQNKYYSIGTVAWAEDCPSLPDIVHWNIDSVIIWEIINGDSTRVENNFALLPSRQVYSRNNDTLAITNDEDFLSFFKDETSYHSNPTFILTKTPTVLKKAAYRFQFYDASGQVFEAKSEQINIAP